MSELIGAELDAAVAVAAGLVLPLATMGILTDSRLGAGDWHPSTDWSQGGPIIERERIELIPRALNDEWCAYASGIDATHHEACGKTPLIAAMRAFCHAKMS